MGVGEERDGGEGGGGSLEFELFFHLLRPVLVSELGKFSSFNSGFCFFFHVSFCLGGF